MEEAEKELKELIEKFEALRRRIEACEDEIKEVLRKCPNITMPTSGLT